MTDLAIDTSTRCAGCIHHNIECIEHDVVCHGVMDIISKTRIYTLRNTSNSTCRRLPRRTHDAAPRRYYDRHRYSKARRSSPSRARRDASSGTVTHTADSTICSPRIGHSGDARCSHGDARPWQRHTSVTAGTGTITWASGRPIKRSEGRFAQNLLP